MAVIVIDANYMGGGRYHPKQVWRLQAEVDATWPEIFVPEVVLWEWAEHLHRDLEALRSKQRSLRVDPSVLALPDLPAPSMDELVDSIAASVEKFATVWRPDEEAYRSAVQAQVLQHTTGRRRSESEVKTGAADYIVYRCVEACLDEHEGVRAVVLATADRELADLCSAAFESRGLIVASHHNDVLRAVLSFEPASEDLAEKVEEYLRYAINEVHVLAHGHSGVEPEADRVELDAIEEITVETLDIVGGGDKRLGAGTIRVVGSLKLTDYRYEQVGEDDFVAVEDWSGVLPTVLEVPVSVTFDRDWEVETAEAGGVADIQSLGY